MPFPPPNEKETGIREIYVAFSIDMKPAEFRDRLLQVFKGAKQQDKRERVDRVGREPIVFDRWAWVDGYRQSPSIYLIYAAQGDSGTTVAVAFRVPDGKETKNKIQTAVRFTLQSLVIGKE